MSQIIQLYHPHLNQKKIHASKARYRVVVAGRRFGKSALALNEAVARAFQLKNQIIWIILPHAKQAREVYWIDPDIMRYFMPYVQLNLIKKNDTDLSLFIKSTGSWIRIKGSDDPDSLRGSGLDLIVWDEVADTKEQAFDIISPALADSPNHRVLFIGTPRGLNFFHDFALQGDHKHVLPGFGKDIKLDREWETWQFTSYDNETWPEGSFERQTFVNYLNKEKMTYQEKGKLAYFNQEYLASFEESAGRFFPRWMYHSHVFDNPLIPNEQYPRYGSFDWGRLAPMAWYAHAVIPQSQEGLKFNRIITFAEVYATQKSPAEQAEDIMSKIDYSTIENTYYDPSMDSKQDDGSISVADQFRRAFNKATPNARMIAASNKRPPRWAAMENWMRIAPDGLPYWMITPNCKNLIRTIPLMMSNPNRIDDIDCFVAGTKISTPIGDRNVETLKIGDYVHTPIGPRKVIKAGISGKSERIIKIFLSNGKTLKGTANHEVYVHGKGMIELQNLTVHDILGTKTTTNLWKRNRFFTTIFSILVIQADYIIHHQLNLLNWAIKNYISKYIWIILDKFQKDTIFIIETLTMITTGQLTLSHYQAKNISSYTSRETMLIQSKKQSITNGIIQKKGMNNCLKTPIRCIKILQKENLLAGIVERLKQQDTQQENTAQQNVSSKKNKVSHVLSVVKTWLGKTQPVHIRVVGNYEEGIVYKLTIEEAHLYYANGILATNTTLEDHAVDSVSYFMQYIPWSNINIKTGPLRTPDKRQLAHSGYAKRGFEEYIEIDIDKFK